MRNKSISGQSKKAFDMSEPVFTGSIEIRKQIGIFTVNFQFSGLILFNQAVFDLTKNRFEIFVIQKVRIELYSPLQRCHMIIIRGYAEYRLYIVQRRT